MFICPTRSRPHNMRRLIEACAKVGGLDVDWYVRVDSDDPSLDEYRKIEWPDSWRLVIGESKEGCCGVYNEAFEAYPYDSFYGHFADDIVPQTKGWAEALIHEAGPDGYAFGDDGINGGELGTHGVIGGELARKLGWLSLPGLKRIYDDTALTYIARKLGVLRYRSDIKVTHLHFSNGGAWDEIYTKPSAEKDREVFEAWRTSSPLLA
jgi:hypothetical protein